VYDSSFVPREKPSEVIWNFSNTEKVLTRLNEEVLRIKSIKEPTFFAIEEEEQRYKKIFEDQQQIALNSLGYALYSEDEQSRQLQADLDKLQKFDKEECSYRKLLVYYHNNDNGFGSEFHWIQLALTAAYPSSSHPNCL
jgi:hypothetical protein